MKYTAKGTIYEVLPEKPVGNSTKREFVVEMVNGEYTSKVSFQAWNERITPLSFAKKGDAVEVDFTISAREYNGKWYNDLRVIRIGLEQPAAPAEPANEPEPSTDDLPF